MIYCFDEDVSFFNYILEKDSIPYTRSQSPTNSVVLLHTPYPWTLSWANKVETVLQSNPRRVIVFVTELHEPVSNWIIQHPNLEYYSAGIVYRRSTIKQHYYMDWFAITRDFYQNREHILSDVWSSKVRDTVTVNALLGRKKPHRDIVYAGLKDNPNVVMTYMHTQHSITSNVQDPNQFVWEGKPQSVNWTIDKIDYDGEQVSLSQVIPTSIYKNTSWCLVAETNYHSGYIFFTEKIAKPILAKKPFIIAGNPHSLPVLHALGFKTFSNLIDESYDSIEDMDVRMSTVVSVTNYLTSMPPAKVRAMHDHIQLIVEHNYRVMMDTDWQRTNLDKLSKMIL